MPFVSPRGVANILPSEGDTRKEVNNEFVGNKNSQKDAVISPR